MIGDNGVCRAKFAVGELNNGAFAFDADLTFRCETGVSRAEVEGLDATDIVAFDAGAGCDVRGARGEGVNEVVKEEGVRRVAFFLPDFNRSKRPLGGIAKVRHAGFKNREGRDGVECGFNTNGSDVPLIGRGIAVDKCGEGAFSDGADTVLGHCALTVLICHRDNDLGANTHAVLLEVECVEFTIVDVNSNSVFVEESSAL